MTETEMHHLLHIACSSEAIWVTTTTHLAASTMVPMTILPTGVSKTSLLGIKRRPMTFPRAVQRGSHHLVWMIVEKVLALALALALAGWNRLILDRLLMSATLSWQ